MSRVPPTWKVPGIMSNPSSGSGPTEGALSFKGLYVYNSLSRSKVPFHPRGPTVSFYICGPTVYDSAHFGHARNYVTFDILRRVLEDYFHYPVFTVMNITDIDDKIIVGARKSHLLQQFESEHAVVTSDVHLTLIEAMERHVAALGGKVSAVPAERQAKGDAEHAFFAERLAEAQQDLDALRAAKEGAALNELLTPLRRDALGALLDKRLGHTCTDPELFRRHAARFEGEFMRDLRDLGVRPPDALTRVSEYVPEVRSMVSRIMDRGLAYEAGGSVYFDTRAFDAADGHFYAKLRPQQVGDSKALAEGEGSLVGGTSGKRHDSDFALWKASRSGEPAWPFPGVGDGRPGWHIECSAMAHALCGERLDVHGGGVDLQFPHHDNEMAQTEAALGCSEWVDYFWHSGHLDIDGLKMSKSLKNFFTIAEVRERHTARQIRLYFLSVQWNAGLDWTAQGMQAVAERERRLLEFLRLAEAAAARGIDKVLAAGQRWEGAELALNAELSAAQAALHAALCDNFNTPLALEKVMDAVRAGNSYMAQTRDGAQPLLLRKAAAWVLHALGVFGVKFPEVAALQREVADAGTEKGERNGGGDADALQALAEFRRDVRRAAHDGADARALLQLCDRLRDEVMPDMGVRLLDDGNALWVRADAEEMRREREEKAQIAGEKAAEKARKRREFLERELKRLREARQPPKPLDEEALGNSSAIKKAKKLLEAQKKKHEKFLAEDGERKIQEFEKELNEME